MNIKSIILIIILSFGLNGLKAQDHNLKQTDSITLYLFLLDDCPICINYTSTLNNLHSLYGNRIDFVGYFPNFSSKSEKIKNYKETYNLEFPLFTDYYKEQAKKWKAQVTPEVFLYNHTKAEMIYQGRIDNKFARLGKRRNIVTEHDLKNAIEATLSGEKVEVVKTEAIGCYINYSDNISHNK